MSEDYPPLYIYNAFSLAAMMRAVSGMSVLQHDDLEQRRLIPILYLTSLAMSAGSMLFWTLAAITECSDCGPPLNGIADMCDALSTAAIGWAVAKRLQILVSPHQARYALLLVVAPSVYAGLEATVVILRYILPNYPPDDWYSVLTAMNYAGIATTVSHLFADTVALHAITRGPLSAAFVPFAARRRRVAASITFAVVTTIWSTAWNIYDNPVGSMVSSLTWANLLYTFGQLHRLIVRAIMLKTTSQTALHTGGGAQAATRASLPRNMRGAPLASAKSSSGSAITSQQIGRSNAELQQSAPRGRGNALLAPAPFPPYNPSRRVS